MNKDIDLEGNNNGYSGTFRWKSNKILPSIPSIPSSLNNIKDNIKDNTINYQLGWMQYLLSRNDYNDKIGVKKTIPLITMAQNDLCMIDCLSTPLSIIHILQKLNIYNNNEKKKKGPITIILIGCSSKAEERILRETNCFLEILLYFQYVELVELILVGPEINETVERLQYIDGKGKTSSWIASLYKGTSIDFFRSNPKYISQSTIVIGINCGYGNFDNPMPKRYDLLLEWLPDLFFLTGMKIPIIFTCANDYSDLYGELTVMLHILGAKLITMPQENPFSFASTFIAEGSKNDNDYSRGNSYYYAIQGHDTSRRYRVQSKGQYKQIVDELQKIIRMKKGIDGTPYLSNIEFTWPDVTELNTNTDTNANTSTNTNTDANTNTNTNANTPITTNTNTPIATTNILVNDTKDIKTVFEEMKLENIVTNNVTNDNETEITTNNILQKIDDNNLIITIPSINNNLDISVSNDGLTLAITYDLSSSKQFIRLNKKINNNNVIAKYSKKKSLLTVIGTII